MRESASNRYARGSSPQIAGFDALYGAGPCNPVTRAAAPGASARDAWIQGMASARAARMRYRRSEALWSIGLGVALLAAAVALGIAAL